MTDTRTPRDRIIEELRRNGLLTVAQLAVALGLSRTSIRYHVMRLLEQQALQMIKAAGSQAFTLPEAEESGADTGTRPVTDGDGGKPPAPPAGGSGGGSIDSKGEGQDNGKFDSKNLNYMMISLPLRELLEEMGEGENHKGRFLTKGRRISLIIDVNFDYTRGTAIARQRLFDLLVRVAVEYPDQLAAAESEVPRPMSQLDRIVPPRMRELSGPYVFAWLTPPQIKRLAELELRLERRDRVVYRIWPDNIVENQSDSSMPTIKADAAGRAFGCDGSGIVWAVVDSGIDDDHPHFRVARNLRDLPVGVTHADLADPEDPKPLVDGFGHGTHVAGIIAGSLDSQQAAGDIRAEYLEQVEGESQTPRSRSVDRMTGVAPNCKLVSYKVLDSKGRGSVTKVIAALEDIYRCNSDGRNIRIHGVNLSLGYPFEARWYACGQSPLCEVVDRLARSGVVVVVAAGNNGYGLTEIGREVWGQGKFLSITDPGNAERAITVGSTHRTAPHTYGVSYFSSKGPTGDGRCKPDLLAPGEKILSCASTTVQAEKRSDALYKEDSGTSMAAPHVSGAIAGFLSVRREFIGRAEQVKAVFLASAIDLKRNRDMQGHGLLDLMRALQSV